MIVDTNWPPLVVFAPLLTAVGIGVAIFGAYIGFLTRRQLRRQNQEEQNPHAPTHDPPVPINIS